MMKYMSLGIKSDDELLSLSCNGALFINLDAGSGPLRSGMKDRMMLKEMEARAESLAGNGEYTNAEEIEQECCKLREEVDSMQREYEKAKTALRLAKVTSNVVYFSYSLH
jgi:precorrin-3B methylase